MCIISALLITGGSGTGNSVEMFVPSSGRHCNLPDIPGGRRVDHTMEKLTICGGGYYTSTFCLTLTDGTWETSTTLREERWVYWWIWTWPQLSYQHFSCLWGLSPPCQSNNDYNYQEGSLQLGLTVRNDLTRRKWQSQDQWEDSRWWNLYWQLQPRIWSLVIWGKLDILPLTFIL